MNYRKLLRILTFILINMVSLGIMAQENHEEHNHHHHKNEISIAAGVVPIPEEDEVAAGLHLHYVRGIGHANRFGIGTSFETIFDEHKHYAVSVVFQYRVFKGLIVGYGPGLAIVKEDEQNELLFAQHIELAWEFEISKFHIGPMVEVGIGDGIHYMAGVHFGLDF